MDLNYFDLIATIIILLLGLKGIINGFFKEVFGLIGIIGGIFIASRAGDSVGLYLSNLIFKFENHAAISFTGFLATLFVFWFLMVMVGIIFKKLSSISGLGPMDKLLGFFFGASKFFLIASVIAYAAYNVKAIRASIDSVMKDSVIFPMMVSAGGFIMKIDPVNMADDINKTIGEQQEKMQKQIEQTIQDSTLDIVNKAKEQIKGNISVENLQQAQEELKNSIPETVKEGSE